MKRWFKFEEKKPRPYKSLLLWDPILGVRLGHAGYSYKIYCDMKIEPYVDIEKVKFWQYAPKGPKEESEKS